MCARGSHAQKHPQATSRRDGMHKGAEQLRGSVIALRQAKAPGRAVHGAGSSCSGFEQQPQAHSGCEWSAARWQPKLVGLGCDVVQFGVRAGAGGGALVIWAWGGGALKLRCLVHVRYTQTHANVTRHEQKAGTRPTWHVARPSALRRAQLDRSIRTNDCM